MVIGEQRAVPFQEIEQAGDLFQVRWYVGIVAPEMHVIELYFNHVFDAGAQVACRRIGCLSACWMDG
jgi:hypothetical protein